MTAADFPRTLVMLRVGMQPVTLCVIFKGERRAPGTIRSDYNATSFA